MEKTKLRKILKIAIALVAVAAISVLIFFILKWCGIDLVTTEGRTAISNWISSQGGWAVLIYLGIEVLIQVVLCFVPVASMAAVVIGVLAFGPQGANWNIGLVFLICFSGVVISSIIMDLIGRFGGTKAIIKLVGKEDYDEAIDLVQEKGMVYVPVMYLLPMFPDDAICMVCGSTKIKFWLHLIYIFLFRGIGCATIVFGIDIVRWPGALSKETLWDWIVVLTVILFWLFVIVFVARKIDKWLSKKLKEKREKKENENRE